MSDCAPACDTRSNNSICSQESYVTHNDNLRLAGEIISILGAFVILLLEVTL